MSFRVEPNSDAETSFSTFGKLYNSPRYLFRKLVFYMCKSSISTVALLSNWMDFHFDYDLDEQAKWKWSIEFSLPRYTLTRKQ